MQERRCRQRVRPTGHLRARVHRSDPARVLDLSPFGAFIETPTALRPGSECDVVLELSDSGVQTRGFIKRCRASRNPERGALVYHAALEFVPEAGAGSDEMENLIAKLVLLSDRREPMDPDPLPTVHAATA